MKLKKKIQLATESRNRQHTLLPWLLLRCAKGTRLFSENTHPDWCVVSADTRTDGNTGLVHTVLGGFAQLVEL